MRFLLINLVVLMSVAIVHAQEQPLNKPIELPEFIVTGTSLVDIPGGAKQAPARPPLLRAALLDSLNPLEKLALPALPEAPLPEYSQPFPYWPAYVRASIGNYLTPSLDAGYSFDAGGYLIDVTANLEASDGWVDNADYLMYQAGVMSTYVAPDKFLFFGGSTTVVDVQGGQKDFKLFADPTAPSRSIGMLTAGVETTGESDGIRFHGAAEFTGTSLDDEGVLTGNNVFTGLVTVDKQFGGDLRAGLGVDIRLQGWAANSYPYTSAYATADIANENLRFEGKAGVQLASATTGDDRFGVLLEGHGSLFVSPTITFMADVRSGLRPLNAADLLMENPYMDRTSQMDVPYDLFRVGGAVMFHPVIRVTATAGIEIAQTERNLVWTPTTGVTFQPDYLTTSTFELYGDVRWLLTSKDVLVADVSILSATVSDAESMPYVPSFTASIGHDRAWSEKITSTVALIYVGDRFVDLANTRSLSGFIDIRAKAGYRITNELSIEIQAQNLLGSTMVIWDGYRERNVFITGGILWKF